MRLLIDSLIALMLVGILAAVVLHHRVENQQIALMRQAHQALARLQEQAVYRGALDHGAVSATGFPLAISPLWFEGDIPANPFVPGRQTWIDLAPPGDMADHPPDPVTHAVTQAAFWYNPNRGIFRARVAAQFSDQDTLELYNRLNGVFLASLPNGPIQRRQPTPMELRFAPDGSARMPAAYREAQGAGETSESSSSPARPSLRR